MVGKKFCAALCGVSMFWAAPKCEASLTGVVLKICGVSNILIGAGDALVGILGSTAGAAVGAEKAGPKGAAAGSLVGIVNIAAGVGNFLMGAANFGLASVVDDNDANKEKIKALESKVEMLSVLKR